MSIILRKSNILKYPSIYTRCIFVISFVYAKASFSGILLHLSHAKK
jgi:hypothetical protein